MNEQRQKLIKKLAEHSGLGELSDSDVQAIGQRVESQYINDILDGKPPLGKQGADSHGNGKTQSD